MANALRRLRTSMPAIAWVMLLALIVIGAGIGLRDPWPADEPRFALVARDMVLTGEWLFPRVGNVLYPDKPPLYFWLMAACYMITGSLRVAFLLPSLLAALGTLWLVHDLGRRLWNARTGIAAALVLLATLQFVLQAKSAQIDATLVFFTTLGLYGLCRHLLLGPAWGWYIAGFAAAGAGVITKGVGFLPLLLFIPWAYAVFAGWRELPRIGRSWRWLLGPLAMLAVIAAWLVPMLIAVNAANDAAFTAYRDNILFTQTAERYADSWVHVEPFWYYLVEVIPVFWLPVTVALPWLLPAWSRRLRAHDATLLVLLGWIVLVVLFFSLSSGKRGLYILPAVPALALATAPFVEALLRRRGVHYAAYGVLTLLVLLLVLALAHFLLLQPEKGAALVERYDASPWLFVGLLITTGIAWMLAAPKRGMHALCGFFLSVWLIYSLYAYPAFNDARSPASMMRKAGSIIGEGELALLGWREQLVLHADRPVVHFGSRRRGDEEEVRRALAWLVRGPDRYLLLPDEAVTDCFDKTSLRHLDFVHRRNWWLASLESVKGDCRDRARNAPEPRHIVTS